MSESNRYCGMCFKNLGDKPHCIECADAFRKLESELPNPGKTHEVIFGNDKRADLASRLPPFLQSHDGRFFLLKSWKPVVVSGEVVSVTVEAYVMVKKENTK